MKKEKKIKEFDIPQSCGGLFQEEILKIGPTFSKILNMIICSGLTTWVRTEETFDIFTYK